MFDHPAASEWMNHDVGDSITFSGENGTSTYNVTQIENNGPDSTGAFDRTEEELICQVRRDFTLVSDDTEGSLLIQLAQNEPLNVPSSEESLGIFVDIQFRDRPPIAVATLFAQPLEENGIAPFVQARYQPEATLGPRVFQDVISSTALSRGAGHYQAGEIEIVSIAFARGVGLAALERTDVGLLVRE